MILVRKKTVIFKQILKKAKGEVKNTINILKNKKHLRNKTNQNQQQFWRHRKIIRSNKNLWIKCI